MLIVPLTAPAMAGVAGFQRMSNRCGCEVAFKPNRVSEVAVVDGAVASTAEEFADAVPLEFQAT
jgi:hypothetical protein